MAKKTRLYGRVANLNPQNDYKEVQASVVLLSDDGKPTGRTFPMVHPIADQPKLGGFLQFDISELDGDPFGPETPAK